MPKKIIQVDFIRELSLWQQEIEVEANHKVLPKVLGIPVSVFFFSYNNGIATAYRLKKEREKLPQQYIKLASRKNFAKNLYYNTSADIKYLKHTKNNLIVIRKKLIDIWPAYLFGYNIIRYYEKDLFIPETNVQRENLKWAKKMHLRNEGIYDIVESNIENQLDNKKNKDRLVVDQDGIQKIPLTKYLKIKKYQVEKEKVKHSKFLKGIVACRGRVVGKVQILSKAKEYKFDKFKKGNVLVAMTTSPRYLPAIRNAAAIVTDFGGQASHAAIISRELKKPCIVGTKIATKTLKNGQKVEVDAIKGIVKII